MIALLLESYLFIAYIKKEDWLKGTAHALINAIEDGRLSPVQASTEVFHEIYYVFSDYAPLSVILADEAKIATIKNLKYVNPDAMIYLTALSIMDTCRMTSIFDAVYAATTLSAQVPDHTIISTDENYDNVKGLQWVDPRQLKLS